MADFRTTIFRFVSTDGEQLLMENAMFYSVDHSWTIIGGQLEDHQKNPGIKNPQSPVENLEISTDRNAIVSLDIDSKIVSEMPMDRVNFNSSLKFLVKDKKSNRSLIIYIIFDSAGGLKLLSHATTDNLAMTFRSDLDGIGVVNTFTIALIN